MRAELRRHDRVSVIVFTGGRGSRVLSRALVRNPRVDLTLAINGYDDGRSTGEVRRLLGDSLGPSDFRKAAGWLAESLETCALPLVRLLEWRFPAGCAPDAAREALRCLSGPADAAPAWLEEAAGRLDPEARDRLREPLGHALKAIESSATPFRFEDCSLGNLVFAGCFLLEGRRFNAAVERYGRLLGLPEGIVQNVTDGEDLRLTGIDWEGRLLATEADIVDDSGAPRGVREIFLLDAAAAARELPRLGGLSGEDLARELSALAVVPRPNARLLERIATADVVIYAPGTQYSSLLPSYLTEGLGTAIGTNLRAFKLLVTNLREDAETRDASAVDLIERALYYLRGRGRLSLPAPCLITHYLINDPDPSRGGAHVPVGRLDTFDDPRLVRVADYEDAATGSHDAVKVVGPFIESLLARAQPPKLAVLLEEAAAPAKIVQSLLEAIRGGLEDLEADVSIFYSSAEPLDPAFVRALPCGATNLGPPETAGPAFVDECRKNAVAVALLFESSGAYRGEDIVRVARHMLDGQVDAVWGSRRLSMRDVHESYRFRYRANPVLGAVSYVGSYVLSLAYLLLYGRFISDTLSGVRAVRTAHLAHAGPALDDRTLNHRLLSSLLRAGGEIFEAPVQFARLSPEKIRRTSVADGVRALSTALWWRVRPLGPVAEAGRAGAAVRRART